MERSVECRCRCRWALHTFSTCRTLVLTETGPAHAVYFATYEAVKHAMGGNEGEKHDHHPLAAGRSSQTT